MNSKAKVYRFTQVQFAVLCDIVRVRKAEFKGLTAVVAAELINADEKAIAKLGCEVPAIKVREAMDFHGIKPVREKKAVAAGDSASMELMAALEQRIAFLESKLDNIHLDVLKQIQKLHKA